MSTRQFTSVLFDFGGVMTTSPFDAFAEYESRNDLPAGFIRKLNSTNPDDNAWAKLERSEVTTEEFAALFEAEARANGQVLSGGEILPLLSGALRPEMVAAVGSLRDAGFRVACLTNNFVSDDRIALHPDPDVRAAFDLFEVVLESSRIGARKPERLFYERALEALGVTAEECVFLDDLGVNLKPAREMGFRTIKVVEPAAALAELESALGIRL